MEGRNVELNEEHNKNKSNKKKVNEMVLSSSSVINFHGDGWSCVYNDDDDDDGGG